MTNIVNGTISPAMDSQTPNPWQDYRPQVIFANPGDVIIQPPGSWHEVYTPCETVVMGGHIISYETLHLMEASRQLDVMRGQYFTNSDHSSIDQTLEHMVTALPSLLKRTFFRKPIAALCSMVLHPERYRPQGQKKRPKKPTPSVVELAERIEKFIYISEDSDDFLSWGNNWMDPGTSFQFEEKFWDTVP
ncbi:hypothetical protein BD779DRAFT_1685454 [Infundibulicybe gibba]|nr:hypothetical protein BD779DRAFT_1685454 [Infundibulicybe gibba]